MLLIENSCTNPYFNLAAEEYLLKHFDEDVFMLWRNEPAVIVGKNQNTLSEINLDYVREHSIPVVRRLTGGGAVFHDLGNLNFTFIFSDEAKSFNNFRKFTEPIIALLNSLSIAAEFSGRNDLTINDKKFSGNAQCNYKSKVMHHGTLLFSSDIVDLSKALTPKSSKFEGKAVKSVSSRVTNISEHLTEPMDILEFKSMLMNYMYKHYRGSIFYEFTKEDLDNIKKLQDEKYSTWAWNFGSSPKYNFENTLKYSGGNVEVALQVEKGIIVNIKIFGDFFGKADISELEEMLTGAEHSEQALLEALRQTDVGEYLAGITAEELIHGLI